MKNLFVIFLFIALFASKLNAEEKIRIGIFDSRLVASWYLDSEENQIRHKKLHEQIKQSLIDNDTILHNELKLRAQLIMSRFKDKAFGRGSVNEFLDNKKSEIEQIAKKENLVAIIPRWELNYSNPNVELIDITILLLEALKAPEQAKNNYDRFKEIDPLRDAFIISTDDCSF